MNLNKILFLAILFLLISCNQKQKQIDTWNERVAKFEETKTSKAEFKSQDVKKVVAEFSKQYAPNRSESLDSIPFDVIKAFKELRTIDKNAHEKYVTLIFTKLYAEHLRCCHQGYIIASQFKNDFDKDKISMVNEFAYMSNYIDYKKLPEAWSSGIVEKWLTENPKLLEFEPIGKHKKIIDSISNKIANRDYWND